MVAFATVQTLRQVCGDVNVLVHASGRAIMADFDFAKRSTPSQFEGHRPQHSNEDSAFTQAQA
jgi:hypothetical protein